MLGLAGFLCPRTGWGAGAAEVRRLGLSRVGENTLLTLILDRPAEPRIFAGEPLGKSQMIVEFPRARLGHVPTRLEGDDILVERVQVQTSPAGGVRIILDLFPDQPYAYWRQSRPGVAGQTVFILGLRPDAGAPRREQRRASPPPEPAPLPPASPQAPMPEGEWETTPPPPEPAREEYRQPPLAGVSGSGSFGELEGLMPKARPLLQNLAGDGWTVSSSNTYDRPGQRFSRDFILANRKYPEMAVKIAYLPANTPGTPNIGIVSLATDNLQSEAASKYRELRQWKFAKIRQKYEDIGDFFDDALKPLRVKLREETKAIALKNAVVFQNFLKAVTPGNPQVAQKVMGYVRQKVSPRFEGVQYTISENPLIILNLVDFLYVKVYFLDSH